jgi:hypothetical protein
VYAKEPDFLNKDCQIKSTDTGFRRCLFSLRGIGTNRLFVLFLRSGFFYSQYAGHGRDQSTEALTSLEVGQFASRLDSLLLNVQYRTNRRVSPFSPSAKAQAIIVTVSRPALVRAKQLIERGISYLVCHKKPMYSEPEYNYLENCYDYRRKTR